MIFSSLLFLFRFLPVVLILYYAAPVRLRNLILFIASLVFYAWGEPVYIVLMTVSILVSYLGGILVDRYVQKGRRGSAKAALLLSCTVSLSLLGFFKYANFLIDTINSLTGAGFALLSISLPIGISFYTFQTMSYTIDVYRGEAKVQKNLISFGAYVAMFPQLIAGPIVNYTEVSSCLKRRTVTARDFESGVRILVIGLGSKVIIADRVGMLWNNVQTIGFNSISTPLAWLGAVA
ncbi:MAG: MBOAT family protein, partial [Lachnospiraceae bacterium]|nr:MBOAT family protein [Lachnospiraceae bacterium]